MTRPPEKTRAPDYAEKRAPRTDRDTAEWSIDDVVHELKARRRRRWKEILVGIAGIIVAIGTATSSVVRAFDHGDRLEKIEKKQKKDCD